MENGKKAKEKEKRYIVRLPQALHFKVKKLAFDLECHMSDLCREGLEMVLEKHKRKK
jgi:hypothetical protein